MAHDHRRKHLDRPGGDQAYEPVLLLPMVLDVSWQTSPGWYDGWRWAVWCALQGRHQHGNFSPLDLCGRGSNDRLQSSARSTQVGLMGAAGQFGIFGTLMLATLLGFPLNEAASIGVIGAIDGPTSIFVATKLAPRLLAPIAVAATLT